MRPRSPTVRAGVALASTVVLTLLAGCASPGNAGAGGEPVRADHVVIPGAWRYDPPAVEIAIGTNVSWVNHGGVEHTVTFKTLAFDASLTPGASTNYTFTQAGTFDYYCKFHRPDMVGRVTVVANGASS